jgi:membrane-associated phospholipid phosphatase
MAPRSACLDSRNWRHARSHSAPEVALFACGHFLPDSGVGNPSGHTAAAAAVYGGLVAMILRFIWDDGRWAFFCAVTTGVLLVVVIGRSRLILDTHSMAEVVVGGAIGIAGAASFVVLIRMLSVSNGLC